MLIITLISCVYKQPIAAWRMVIVDGLKARQIRAAAIEKYPAATRFGLLGSVGGSWPTVWRCHCGCASQLIAWDCDMKIVGRCCSDCLIRPSEQLKLPI